MVWLLSLFLSIANATVTHDNLVIENSCGLSYTTASSLPYLNGSKQLVSTSYALAWPGSQGAANTFPRNDGAGNMSWVSSTVGFPLNAPTSTAATPNYAFDSDTGMYSTADGDLRFSTNAVNALTINNAQNATFAGSVTAGSFIFPTQTAHHVFIGPVSGGPSIPSFRALTTGDVPSSAIVFPLDAPGGSAGAPSYRFDSDTGMYSTGDGDLAFSTNATTALDINNNQQATFSATVTATDFIYPAKTANTFLAGPTTGSPAVPGFRTIQAGDIGLGAIPVPLQLGGGSAGTPTYAFDSDSGMFSPSDGIVAFSTNGVERWRFENNGDIVGTGTLTFNGNATFTGNISAANYPPTDSANTLARFDNSGVLDASSWSIDPDYTSLTAIVSPSSGAVSDFWQIRNQTNLSSTVTGGYARSTWFSLNNSAASDNLVGASWDYDLPITNNATLMSMSIGGSSTVGGDGHIFDIGWNAPVTGNYLGFNYGATGTVGGDSTDYYINNGSTTTGNKTLYSASHYGSAGNDLNYITINGSGNAGNNFRMANLNNSGTVAQFASGFTLSQSGVVTKGFDAFGASIQANVGDGTGVNLNFMNAGIGNGLTIDGNVFLASLGSQATVTGNIFGQSISTSGPYAGGIGLYWNQTGNMTGNNNFSAADVSNSGTGYSVNGYRIQNSGALTESFLGFRSYDNGGARTATGAEFILAGAYTDDIRGLKVDVSAATSTNNAPSGIEITGGKNSIQGGYLPKNSVGVDIGNNFSTTATINSPLTGTDSFLTFMQSNLIVHDDISTGPYGIDTNMVGIVGQAVVDSGKTVPLVRGMILGTSTPSGSGGNITEYVGLEILGLPSFGGSVNNPTRTMLQDSQILGQALCDGTTTDQCWGIRVRDANAINWFHRGVITGGASGVFTQNVELEVSGDAAFGGMIKDGSGNDDIDVNGRHLIKNGNNVVDWDNAKLTDNSGNVSVEWGDRRLRESGGTNVLDWGIQQLRDTSNTVSVNWQNRKLNDSAGADSLEWDTATDVTIIDKHLSITQASPPVATVDANAGGAGACAVSNATDNAFHLAITTDTGAASGSQCDVAFNKTFTTNTVCTWSPTNSNAAANTVFAYHTVNTTDFVMNFGVAGGVGLTYEWDVHCL